MGIEIKSYDISLEAKRYRCGFRAAAKLMQRGRRGRGGREEQPYTMRRRP